MATYSQDIESASGFMPENQFTSLLEEYRKKSRKPTLQKVEFNRPGVDQQSYYSQLGFLKEAGRVATETAFVQSANRRAQQSLADAQSMGNLAYDLSGVSPRYTGVAGTLQSKGQYGSPLRYPSVSSTYGRRKHPISGVYKMHTGVDFRAATGTPIYATHTGRVSSAGWNGAYGNQVIIAGSGGLTTMYGHQSRLAVSSGQYVKRGQLIGYVGSTGRSTGPHLHYEVRIGGRTVSPAGYY